MEAPEGSQEWLDDWQQGSPKSGNAASGSMKTMLEDRAAASLARLEQERTDLSRVCHRLSEALRAVRVARAEGTPDQLDVAIAELRAYVELAE